jgi:hypothetical protein
MGGHNLIGGVREHTGEDAYSLMSQEIKDAFIKSDIPEVIRLMDKHFGTHNYSLWHLFRDEQRKVFNQILDSTLNEIRDSFRHIFERYYPVIHVMRELRIPLPKALAIPVEFILNIDLRNLLESKEIDLDRLEKLVKEIKRLSLELDTTTLNFVSSQKINAVMEKFSQTPQDLSLLETMYAIFRTLSPLSLNPDLWKAQNIYFSTCKQLYDEMGEKAVNGDQGAKKWLELFTNVGHYLRVRCP